MSASDLKERLRLATGEALERLASVEEESRRRAAVEGAADAGPLPGELYVLEATSEWPVEWLVLSRSDGRFLALLADTQPLVGSRDVAVPASAGCGPLSVRCDAGVRLEAGVFEARLRTGRLDEMHLGRARRRLEEVTRGEVGGSFHQREVDRDPSYQDWLRQVVSRAREVVAPAEPAAARPDTGQTNTGQTDTAQTDIAQTDVAQTDTGHRGTAWWPLAAAALLLLAAGLGFRVVSLQQQVEALSGPIFDPPYEQISFADRTRGPSTLSFPESVPYATLYLELPEPSAEASRYRVRILDHRSETIWESQEIESQADHIPLTLPRTFLPPGDYQVVLLAGTSSALPAEPLESRAFRVERPREPLR